MKKLLITLIILFGFVIGIMIYYFFDTKKEEEKELYKINKNQVDIINNKALSNIYEDDIIISEITIIKNEYLIFNIQSEKTSLSEKEIEIIFYNDYAVNPGLVKTFFLNDYDLLSDKKGNIKVNVEDIYNNPYRIEINVK